MGLTKREQAASPEERRALRRQHRYTHAANRLEIRYGVGITEDEYDLLCDLCKKQDVVGLRMRPGKAQFEAWVKFKSRWVCACFNMNEGLIGTFLPAPPLSVLIDIYDYEDRKAKKFAAKAAPAPKAPPPPPLAPENPERLERQKLAPNAEELAREYAAKAAQAAPPTKLPVVHPALRQSDPRKAAQMICEEFKVTPNIIGQMKNAALADLLKVDVASRADLAEALRAIKTACHVLWARHRALKQSEIEGKQKDQQFLTEQARDSGDRMLLPSDSLLALKHRQGDISWFKLQISKARRALERGQFEDAVVLLDALASLPKSAHPSINEAKVQELLEQRVVKYRDELHQRGHVAADTKEPEF